MTLTIRIVCAVLVVSCIFSCKKESNKSASNKFLLSKLITWKLATPSKGIVTTEFTYDGQERVVKIVFFTGDSVGDEINSAKYRGLKFYYNGNEKSPYMTLGSGRANDSSFTENFHTYDVTGSLVRDSVHAEPPYNSTHVKRYAYAAGKIIVKNEFRDNSYTEISKDSFKVVNNNLVEGYITVSATGQAYGYKLRYDNKINPLNKLNIASISVVAGLYGFPSYLAPGFCKNNISDYTSGYSVGAGQFSGGNIYKYTYSYNKDSLPEECRTSDNITKYYYNE